MQQHTHPRCLSMCSFGFAVFTMYLYTTGIPLLTTSGVVYVWVYRRITSPDDSQTVAQQNKHLAARGPLGFGFKTESSEQPAMFSDFPPRVCAAANSADWTHGNEVWVWREANNSGLGMRLLLCCCYVAAMICFVLLWTGAAGIAASLRNIAWDDLLIFAALMHSPTLHHCGSFLIVWPIRYLRVVGLSNLDFV